MLRDVRPTCWIRFSIWVIRNPNYFKILSINYGHTSLRPRRRFFSFLVIRPQLNGVFGQTERTFSQTVSRLFFVFFFKKKKSLSLSYGRTKKVFFQNDNVIHYPALALYKGCYHIFIVLAFSCGRAKNDSGTLRLDTRFFQKGKKISVFKNIRILVNDALMLTSTFRDAVLWCYHSNDELRVLFQWSPMMWQFPVKAL